MQPEPAQPGPVRSKPVRSKPVQPEPVRPELVRSGLVQPEPVRPELVQPEPVQPESERPESAVSIPIALPNTICEFEKLAGTNPRVASVLSQRLQREDDESYEGSASSNSDVGWSDDESSNDESISKYADDELLYNSPGRVEDGKMGIEMKDGILWDQVL